MLLRKKLSHLPLISLIRNNIKIFHSWDRERGWQNGKGGLELGTGRLSDNVFIYFAKHFSFHREGKCLWISA
jgi:hypothetical protein